MKKTVKAVTEERSEYTRLIKAVIRQLGGVESIEDINRHGIAGGYGKFCYYSDTVPFAYRHRKNIISLLEEMADSLGEDVVQMVSGFGVFRNNPMDKEDRTDLYKYLGGGKCVNPCIPNLMSWFAAEEVCRWFEVD